MDALLFVTAGVIAIPFLMVFGGISVAVIVFAGKLLDSAFKKVFGDSYESVPNADDN